MRRSIKGMGRIFPIKQMANAGSSGTLSMDAAISPPLSSKIGISEIINIVSSAGIVLLKNPINSFTKVSVTLPPR